MTFFFIAKLFLHLGLVWASEGGPLLTELKSLVEINSGTTNREGVARVQSYVAEELKKIGFEVKLDDQLLLEARFAGSSRRAKVITFLAHADTVFDPAQNFTHVTETSPGFVRGPGVIDDKGGIVIALEGLRRYLKDKKSAYSLRFVVSPSEETGSRAVLDALKRIAAESWLVLGFEPALEDGSVVGERRGLRWYHLHVVGKEAHSGRAHKDGINACVALAKDLVEISKLTDYAKDVTVSVGHMNGGKDKFNIVCGEAEAKIDARFGKLSERERLDGRIQKILQAVHVPGATTSFEIDDDSPPFQASSETKAVATLYLAKASKLEGHDVRLGKSGGSADSNIFSLPEVMILDGLGPVGGKMHTEEEFLKVSSLESRAEALHQLLLALP